MKLCLVLLERAGPVSFREARTILVRKMQIALKDSFAPEMFAVRLRSCSSAGF